MIRLARLDLVRWGSFGDRTLDFGAADARLQLVYGDNEAGKSTAQRAVRGLLFGIPARTPDAHTHGYGDLRIGALLVTGDGQVEVVRRKGKVQTLLTPAGESLVDDPISKALGTLSADVYAGLFEISHQSLVEGGHALLDGRGAVGESLFAAAAGTGRLHRLIAALDAEAGALFKPRGQSGSLNQAIAEHTKAEKKLRNQTLRPTRVRELRRAVEAADGRIDEIDARIRGLEEEGGRLHRMKAVKPRLARHRELQAELAALGDPPALDSRAGEFRADAQRSRDGAQRRARRARDQLENIRSRQQQLCPPEDLLAEGPAITRVHSQLSAITKAATDRRKREGELQGERARLESLLLRIRPGMEAADLDFHAASERARRELERCLEQRGAVVERQRAAQDRLSETQRELEETGREYHRLPEVLDARPLRAASRSVAKLGPLEERVAEYRLRAATLRNDAAGCFDRLAPRPRQLDQIPRLAVPSREVVERFTSASKELRKTESAIDHERASIDRRSTELAARRAELRVGADAPTADRLQGVRSRRDGEWILVREALTTPSEHAHEHAERFERSVREADQVADARAAQANQLAQLGELERSEARLETERESLAGRVRDLEGRWAKLEREWQAVWEGSGIPAPAIANAASWLVGHEEILALLRDAERADRDAESEEKRVDWHRAVLGDRLAAVGSNAAADARLDELIELAEEVADALEEAAGRRADAEQAIERGRSRVTRERTSLGEAETNAEAWSSEWARLRDSYGLDPELSPEDAADVLQTIDEALRVRERAEDLRLRIEAIDRDRGAFEEEVDRVRAEVARNLSPLDAEHAAGELVERLTEAERAREALDGLQEQVEREESELSDAEREKEVAEKELEAMVEAAGAADEEELPELERRSVRSAELREEIPRCEREVAEAGEESFEVLRSAAFELSGEKIDARISQLERDLDTAREQRDQAQKEAFEARAGLRHAEDSDGAAQAADAAEQQLATARELAERYAVTRLASRLLHDTIERYRSRHQGPLLARANELFPLLTCHAFSELFIDWSDAGDPVLVGRDASGRSVGVDAMSDGTREQLFLALRIAALERYVDSSGPVPVIFDDVFLESDDRRSERILVALADLAARTQVIVFTHHQHLVAIAQRMIEPDRLAVHDLSDGRPLLRLAGAPAGRAAA